MKVIKKNIWAIDTIEIGRIPLFDGINATCVEISRNLVLESTKIFDFYEEPLP